MSKKVYRNVYVTPNGMLKIGTRGKMQPPGDLLKILPKGERRKVRKAARKMGFDHVARA